MCGAKEKEVPSTRGRVLIAGLRRSVIALLILSAFVCGAALLMVRVGDMSVGRAFPLAFYLGGALIAVGGFLGALAGPSAAGCPRAGSGGTSVRRRSTDRSCTAYSEYC